jgi:putative transposase
MCYYFVMVTVNRFSTGEIYHCYNRGVDKRITFNTKSDYDRFIELLFLCNGDHAKERSDIENGSRIGIFDLKRGDPLVSIGAYALMPNHFHLLLRETKDAGISRFMSKLGNSYTKYFNIKNNRSGNLFIKPFLSKHIKNDNHFSHIAQYIHLNPAELIESGWKNGVIKDLAKLEQFLEKYKYSSLPDYLKTNREQSVILDKDFAGLISKDWPKISNIIKEAAEYYLELNKI